MAEPYVIKPSPGKGEGVFATRDIESGEVVMRDQERMKIERRGVDVTDEQVSKAFEALSIEDQSTFMTLHPGIIPYKTKLKRIYKTNMFGNEEVARVYFKVSKLNHACAPNAEMADKGQVAAYALKPIAEGKEIFISYYTGLCHGAKPERNQLLWETNGFTCQCKTCNLQGEAAFLSDGRRQLLNFLSHKVHGFEPPQLQTNKRVVGSKVERKLNILGSPPEHLRAPLTVSERAAYWFLLAKLLEAEGLINTDTTMAYMSVSAALSEQILEHDGAIVLPSTTYLNEWVTTAFEYTKEIRHAGSRDLQMVFEHWEGMRQRADLRLASAVVSLSPSSTLNC